MGVGREKRFLLKSVLILNFPYSLFPLGFYAVAELISFALSFVKTEKSYLLPCLLTLEVFRPLPCFRYYLCVVQFLCTSHNNVPVHSITVFKVTYVGCMCVQLQPVVLTFGKMTWDLLHATAITYRWKVGPGEENYPVASAGTQTQDLLPVN